MVLCLIYPGITTAQSDAPSPLEEPRVFQQARAAMDNWDYDRAAALLQTIHRNSQQRPLADKLLDRINTLRRLVVEYTVQSGDDWEGICLIYFRSADYAARLARFNKRTPQAPLKSGETIHIPRIHVDVLLGYAVFVQENEVRLEDMAAGLRLLEHADSLDPDYPGLQIRLERARHHFTTRLHTEQIDSLDKTAELFVARREFSAAIRCLRQAQDIRTDPQRTSRVRSLIAQRRESIPVLFELGNTAFRENDLEAALRYWRQVLDADPEYRDIRERIDKTQKMLDNMNNAGRKN